MKDNVVNEARSFIINSKPKVDQLSPQEEKVLLQKFNEELRNSICALMQTSPLIIHFQWSSRQSSS